MQVLVPLVGGIVEGLLEQVELELRAAHHRVARLLRPLHLALQDLAGGHLDRLVGFLVRDVADHHGGLRDPRDEAEGREVRDQLEIAVARLPARVAVSGERLHLHVDRQQVQAGVEAFVGQHLLQEEVRKDALAHVPALEVGEHAQDRVNLALVDELLQVLDAQLASLHGAASFSGSLY